MDLWTVLLSWGALQGVVLAIALGLPRRRGGPGEPILLALILALTLPLVEHCFIHQGVFLVDPRGLITFVGTPVLFLPGPLFYWYACVLCSRSIPRRRVWLHFVPAVVMALDYAPTYAAILGSVIGTFDLQGAAAPGPLVRINGYVEWGSEILQLAVYLLLSRPVLRGFESALSSHVSRSSALELEWLRRIALVLVGVALVNALALAGMLALGHVAELEYVMALAYALGVQIVGVVACRNPRALDWRAHASPETSSRYAKSGLTAARRRAYRERLLRLMECEKPWLDEDLGLSDLARRAAIPSAHLSEVLSLELATSFFGFVNGYRVDEARRLLADPARGSVLEIAMRAGFSSKSSFNRVFKRVTGTTPTRFARGARGTERVDTDPAPASAGEPADRLRRRQSPPPPSVH